MVVTGYGCGCPVFGKEGRSPSSGFGGLASCGTECLLEGVHSLLPLAEEGVGSHVGDVEEGGFYAFVLVGECEEVGESV